MKNSFQMITHVVIGQFLGIYGAYISEHDTVRTHTNREMPIHNSLTYNVGK